MAAAFAALKGSSVIPGVCSNCSKPSHLKKDCFVHKGAKPKAPDVCPRCPKDHNFANMYHSKYDSEGHPMQGNQTHREGRHCMQTQMPQPTPQMSLLQTPSRGSPQVFA
ncbi:POK9 protein, partial [Bombycilla garrulus]|nr:POK9 protein [Bombycilla garrulus]